MNLRSFWHKHEIPVTIIGCVVTMFIMWFAIQHLQQLIRQEHELKKQLIVKLARIAESKYRLQQHKKSNIFFTHVKSAQVSKSLTQLAAVTKVQLREIVPLPKICNTGLCCYPFQIEMLGSFQQITTVIYLLQAASGYILHACTLQPQEQQLHLGAQVLLYQAPDGVLQHMPKWQQLVPQKLEVQELFTLDYAKLRDLQVWDLTNFKLLGVIQEAKNMWGVITDPVHNIYYVQVGMHLGRQQARIVQINKTMVVTAEPQGRIYQEGIDG